MDVVRLTPNEIARVIAFMRETCGNDLTEKASFIASKLSVLCAKLGYTRFHDFWEATQEHTIAAAQLRQQVIDTLTTSYTYFYREDRHFAQLRELFESNELPLGNSPLRAWSAGCASGEEPYNIAMVLEDARQAGLLTSGYRIVGSDISAAAIKAAVKASYSVADVARLPPHWRNRYCMRSGSEYEIKGVLRNNVEFRTENVLTPRLDAPYDVVFCRNMMIYFDEASIKKLCRVLRSATRPGGYLFLGHTEILHEVEGFAYIEPSVWRRETTSREHDLLDRLFNPETH